MSDSELKNFKNWVRALTIALSVQALTVAWVGISDHFMLKEHEKSLAEIKPRVDQLWWRHQPGDSRVATDIPMGK